MKQAPVAHWLHLRRARPAPVGRRIRLPLRRGRPTGRRSGTYA